MTGWMSVRGKFAKQVAKWLELWGVPHSISPKGYRVKIDCDYSSELHSALDHAVKGVEFPEELYQKRKKEAVPR